MAKIDNSIQSAVYTALKKNIMSLQLKPGTPMSTQEVATKLDVSRTPVREAFIRLERDGLVDAVPKSGTFVSKIRLDRVEQERFIRESLECSNIDMLIEKATPKDIRELELNIEQQSSTIDTVDIYNLIDLDNSFHEKMFQISGQILSWETIQTNSIHYARLRLMTMWNKDVMHGIVLQHQKIVSAIAEKSSEHAKIYMKAHLHRLETQVQDIMKEYPGYFDADSLSIESRFEMLLAENGKA